MPKRSRKVQKKKAAPERDENQGAFDALQTLIAKTEAPGGKDPLAVLLGRRGGLKGGRARAASMTPEERAESASKAAAARWSRAGRRKAG
jgi:hypothetical protein